MLPNLNNLDQVQSALRAEHLLNDLVGGLDAQEVKEVSIMFAHQPEGVIVDALTRALERRKQAANPSDGEAPLPTFIAKQAQLAAGQSPRPDAQDESLALLGLIQFGTASSAAMDGPAFKKYMRAKVPMNAMEAEGFDRAVDGAGKMVGVLLEWLALPEVRRVVIFILNRLFGIETETPDYEKGAVRRAIDSTVNSIKKQF